MNWHPELEHPATGDSRPEKRHQVAFMRGGHTWRLTWDDGDEPLLLETLAALAARTDCPLDEFDRALVHQHLGPAPDTDLPPA